jgi:hypothetical protein
MAPRNLSATQLRHLFPEGLGNRVGRILDIKDKGASTHTNRLCQRLKKRPLSRLAIEPPKGNLAI